MSTKFTCQRPSAQVLISPGGIPAGSVTYYGGQSSGWLGDEVRLRAHRSWSYKAVVRHVPTSNHKSQTLYYI